MKTICLESNFSTASFNTSRLYSTTWNFLKERVSQPHCSSNIKAEHTGIQRIIGTLSQSLRGCKKISVIKNNNEILK